MKKIRVMGCDDHPLIRSGLATVVNGQDDMEYCAEASHGKEALEEYRRSRPDVVLMDLRMPHMGGVDAIKAIMHEFPAARVIALTTYDGDEDIHRALEAGAKGYVLKEMLRTQIVDAIRTVYSGRRAIPAEIAARLAEYTPRVELTDKEVTVLKLLAEGKSNKQIAHVLSRTEGTVKIHVLHILRKLGVSDRTEAATLAIRRGIIHLPE